MARIAYINIQPSVVVDVHKYHTCTPHTVLHDSGTFCNVLKLEIAFVEIDLVVPHIGRKENIRQPVIVQIAHGHAAAIIKVSEKKTILQVTVNYFIIEINAGIFNQLK
jgi:hypothetical protein